MTTQWFTARQLAGLPEMPATSDGVTRRAAREQWPSRPRQGRGGGNEYPAEALPAGTRAALAASTTNVPSSSPAAGAAVPETGSATGQGTAALPPPESVSLPADGAAAGAGLALADETAASVTRRVRQTGLARLQQLPAKARSRAEARHDLVIEFERFAAGRGLSLRKAAPLFVAERNALFPLEPVSERSLWRWKHKAGCGGPAALAGKISRPPRSPIDRDPELKAFVLAMIAEYPHAGAVHVGNAVRSRFAESGAAAAGKRLPPRLPSDGALRRWIAKWKAANLQLFTAHSNPDAWKSRHMVAQGSQSEQVVRINQRWELDSTPADVMLLGDEGTPEAGRPVRHSVIGVVDVWTRRAKLLVTRTSKATAIALLFRRAMLDWGIPETAKTDNGQDYQSKHLARVFHALGVEQVFCPPFQPWHKPHVERFFGTFSHQLVELLPNYIGHNVTDRQAIRDRQSFSDRMLQKNAVLEIRMTASEFQEFCERWTENVYHRNVHASLGCSPFEQALKSRASVSTITDERALDILLAEAPGDGLRTVGKSGIRVDGFEYIAPELHAHVGCQVHVRYDPDQLGTIYVFGGHQMDFVCAAHVPELTGISRKEVAAIAREKQKAAIQTGRALLRANAKRHKVKDIAEEILRSAESEAGSVVAFRQRRDEHETPEILSAKAAAAAGSAPVMADDDHITAREQETLDNLIREEELARRRRAEPQESAEDRFARWHALAQRDPDALTAADRDWMEVYQTSSEFAAQKLIADFESGRLLDARASGGAGGEAETA